MKPKKELKLSKSTPRTYPWIEAFRGRVWRSRLALYGKELILLNMIAILYGVLLDEGLLWEVGLLLCLMSVLLTGMSILLGNLRRLKLVRHGTWVDGELLELTDMRLWHEFLRGKAHRSFRVRYQYSSLEGQKYQGEMVLCRCAYERLAQSKGSIPVVYLPQRPQQSLLLRVAVMRIPH